MDKKVFKLTFFLLVVCAVSGLSIAFVNNATIAAIEQQRAEAIEAGYQEVYPQAESYLVQEYPGDNPIILDVTLAQTGEQVKGIIYRIKPNGYNAGIEMMVGFDAEERRITGIKILKHEETAGLGARITEPEFGQRIIGKVADQALKVVKGPAGAADEVEAITAATITSDAVIEGVNAAREDFMSQYGAQ